MMFMSTLRREDVKITKRSILMLNESICSKEYACETLESVRAKTKQNKKFKHTDRRQNRLM